ncbi:sensor histidine kinase [Modestobacter excelsi]|uniref:sensor histidine kinase n=1 Tax=Modestobacter excelsi TaxID=2213161 RepID=UPI001C20F4B7|nr:histidine kinase [Modestobacter excelsi]
MWLITGLAVCSAFAELVLPAQEPYRSPGVPAAVLAAVSVLCLLWRHVVPLITLAVTSAVVVGTAASGLSVWLVQWPTWIGLFTCFALGDRRLRAGGCALAALGVAGFLVFDRGAFDPTALFNIATIFGIAVVAGDATRSRRTAAAATAGKEVAEARERARSAEQLLVEERGRLARELHDALGHAVTVIVLQAAVGRRVHARNPAFGHDALERIETVGRGALSELDRMLRVLHPGSQETDNAWVEPSLADLDELAAGVRAAGREVHVHTGQVQLSASAGRTVYRIVQEAVTNAVRHTTSGIVRIDVDQIADQVVVEVTNPIDSSGDGPPASADGRGLVNMGERARLEGGSLEAGPVAGDFRIRATIPALRMSPSGSRP